MYNCVLASTSTLHKQAYLAYLLDELHELYINCDEILFIPYARPSGCSHQYYHDYALRGLKPLGKKTTSIHQFDDPIKAIEQCQAIFIGGGNTFLLVSELYRHKLFPILKNKLQQATPYLGTSAGSNICGISMQTTNDMPIVYPPSFKTLGIVPFNINAHYIDQDTTSSHMGETRETRINEFHYFNTIPVVGLREGSYIKLKNDNAFLKGNLTAKLFRANQNAIEIDSETDINTILLPNYLK